MMLSPTKKILLVSAGFFLLIVGITFWVVLPTIRTIDRLSENIHQIEAYLEERLQRSERARLSVQRLPQVEREMVRFDTAFIDAKNVLPLITSLESFAAENEVTQTILIQEQSPIPGMGLVPFSVHLTLSGPFHGAMRYIEQLEQWDTYVIVEKLEVQSSSQNPENIKGATEVQLRIIAKVYGI